VPGVEIRTGKKFNALREPTPLSTCDDHEKAEG